MEHTAVAGRSEGPPPEPGFAELQLRYMISLGSLQIDGHFSFVKKSSVISTNSLPEVTGREDFWVRLENICETNGFLVDTILHERKIAQKIILNLICAKFPFPGKNF